MYTYGPNTYGLNPNSFYSPVTGKTAPQSYPMAQSMYPSMLKGRQVSSIDEVRAAQIDFDGSATYFPCPAQNTIYAKYINVNTGSAVVLEYRLQPAQPVQQQYADIQSVNMLAERITNIEHMLGNVTGGIKNDDATAQSNANVSNAAGQP